MLIRPWQHTVVSLVTVSLDKQRERALSQRSVEGNGVMELTLHAKVSFEIVDEFSLL